MGTPEYAAPHHVAEDDPEANSKQPNSRQNDKHSESVAPDFVRLKRSGRTPLGFLFTAAAAALACSAVAYVIVSCSLAFGRLSSSPKAARLLADGRGDICSPQERGATGDPAGEGEGPPPLVPPPPVEELEQTAGGQDVTEQGAEQLAAPAPPTTEGGERGPGDDDEGGDSEDEETPSATGPAYDDAGDTGDHAGEGERSPSPTSPPVEAGEQDGEQGVGEQEAGQQGVWGQGTEELPELASAVRLASSQEGIRTAEDEEGRQTEEDDDGDGIYMEMRSIPSPTSLTTTDNLESAVTGDPWQRRPTTVEAMMTASDFWPSEEPEGTIMETKDIAASMGQMIASSPGGRRIPTEEESVYMDYREIDAAMGRRPASPVDEYMHISEAASIMEDYEADVLFGSPDSRREQHRQFLERGLVFTGGSAAQGRAPAGSRLPSPTSGTSHMWGTPSVIITPPHPSGAHATGQGGGGVALPQGASGAGPYQYESVGWGSGATTKAGVQDRELPPPPFPLPPDLPPLGIFGSVKQRSRSVGDYCCSYPCSCNGLCLRGKVEYRLLRGVEDRRSLFPGSEERRNG
ncbi:uncharacterized protein EMH_0038130 [Eimeria mitis]|uniref:Transmembrane protein n=1 Tax=Eimeria mitis TaxID=44415 RepID=U6KIR4_9EIME|nr:uncharacterized protein EMH_0038130 [Eimeria mitis]CDJ36167.1 hypothetical protein, conserved [Eimeria mitis]